MSDLTTRLKQLIAARGPLPVSDYMTECLFHPEHGYYVTRDPFGTTGDFITAPEISQMFGELIGLSLAQCWLDQGAPNRFALAELGPGRGTLMADVLRATRGVPGFLDAAEIWMIEASPTLSDIQRITLKPHDANWTGTLSDLPQLPLFLIANEFFDALPIRQYQRAGETWRERVIGLENEALAFGLTPPVAPPSLAHRLEDTKDADVVELCAQATAITHEIGTRINAHGGAALILDYGDWRSLGDTFQALRNHAPVDPLEAPGACDLTAHVDFEAMANAAPCAHSRLTPQGVFLERLGITVRAQTLAKQLTGEALDAHIAAHRRLTHPTEMGTLFKVLGLFPHHAAPPPGLET